MRRCAAEVAPTDTADEPAAARAYSIDELLQLAGGFGRHQRVQAAVCAFCFHLAAACTILPNFTVPRLREMGEDAPFEVDEARAALLNSLFFAGNTLGLIVWGALGDQVGRKPCLSTAATLSVVLGLAEFGSSSFVQFATARVAIGFSMGGLINASFVLLMEALPPAHRMSGKVLLSAVGWVSGVLWLTAVAYSVRDLPWQAIACFLLPSPLLLLSLSCLHESSRWLLTQGRHDDARAALARIGIANRSPLPPRAALAPPLSAGGASPASPEFKRKSVAARARELLHPSLRRQTALVGLAWFGSTAVYYGIVFAPLALGGDVYTQARHVSTRHSPHRVLHVSISLPRATCTERARWAARGARLPDDAMPRRPIRQAARVGWVPPRRRRADAAARPLPSRRWRAGARNIPRSPRTIRRRRCARRRRAYRSHLPVNHAIGPLRVQARLPSATWRRPSNSPRPRATSASATAPRAAAPDPYSHRSSRCCRRRRCNSSGEWVGTSSDHTVAVALTW